MTRWSGLMRGLASLERRYFAIDGGAGAAFIAQLPGTDDRLRPAASPRHADLLIVLGPVSKALMPAVAAAYSDMPTPRELAVIHLGAGAPTFPESGHIADCLQATYTIDGSPTDVTVPATLASSIAQGRGAAAARRGRHHGEVPGQTEVLVPLRSPDEREIATEDVVVSIGPIQRATAGPLQLLITADGEHIMRAEVRAGFAARGLEQLLGSTPWIDGPMLAESLDPIAPLTGRLAYVTAVERLYGLVPPLLAQHARELALRTERAASHLAWLTGFADLLAYDALTAEARGLHSRVLREVPPSSTVVPGDWEAFAQPRRSNPELMQRLAEEAGRLGRRLCADRLFARRTRGVGIVPAERARAVGASGAVLEASEQGAGDAFARAQTRVRLAEADLRAAASLAHAFVARERAEPSVGSARSLPRAISDSPPSTGSAEGTVSGPRGVVTIVLESRGQDRPASVRWVRPSLAHLNLVAELVVGCTLPDALAALASLDLSMAEADG